MLREGLKKDDYVVVHLRGGDKPWKYEARSLESMPHAVLLGPRC